MRLLIADDDHDFRTGIARRLSRQGNTVREADNGNAALAFLEQESFEVALLDLAMPLMDGLELLSRLKESAPNCEVVMLTGEASIESAVAAMKLGAFDFIRKPCPFGELEQLLTRAWQHHRLGRENEQLRQVIGRTAPSVEIIGVSPEIQRVLKLIEKVSPTDSPVLILGESGTGKELVARGVHQQSQRASKPLVTINCAALQESLLESELFGHEKGAFTGATASKPGLFEVADGGTLFIDELGELALSLQAKLLRVLEDGHMRRVGATREQRVDVRIIAATNRNLADDVAARRFREDLFFRINVLSIDLPPLRNRRDDIPLLANHFLRKIGRGWSLNQAALAALGNYSWPGNVRELANVIERASILADETRITLAELPHQISHPSSDTAASVAIEATDNLEERERLHVQRVLDRENWNRSRTAEALGINRRSLYRLIQKHGLQPGSSDVNCENSDDSGLRASVESR
ncbi:response regulator [bacterium]|nr:response regulator [bacterium]